MRFHQFDARDTLRRAVQVAAQLEPGMTRPAVDERLYEGQNMNPGLTPLQGRVAFHQERIFRSTGGGLRAHDSYVTMAKAAGLPTDLTKMSRNQCREALRLIELAARIRGLALFRNVRTGWENV